jgi:AhpD family alkylhydroperoxidase
MCDRRLARDYETLPARSGAMIHLGMTDLMAVLTHLVSASKVLADSTLPDTVQHLVEIRAGQINGCGFCTDMHTKEATHAGETSVHHHPAAGRQPQGRHVRLSPGIQPGRTPTVRLRAVPASGRGDEQRSGRRSACALISGCRAPRRECGAGAVPPPSVPHSSSPSLASGRSSSLLGRSPTM